jgi:hypothetical protein
MPVRTRDGSSSAPARCGSRIKLPISRSNLGMSWSAKKRADFDIGHLTA